MNSWMEREYLSSSSEESPPSDHEPELPQPAEIQESQTRKLLYSPASPIKALRSNPAARGGRLFRERRKPSHKEPHQKTSLTASAHSRSQMLRQMNQHLLRRPTPDKLRASDALGLCASVNTRSQIHHNISAYEPRSHLKEESPLPRKLILQKVVIGANAGGHTTRVEPSTATRQPIVIEQSGTSPPELQPPEVQPLLRKQLSNSYIRVPVDSVAQKVEEDHIDSTVAQPIREEIKQDVSASFFSQPMDQGTLTRFTIVRKKKGLGRVFALLLNGQPVVMCKKKVLLLRREYQFAATAADLKQGRFIASLTGNKNDDKFLLTAVNPFKGNEEIALFTLGNNAQAKAILPEHGSWQSKGKSSGLLAYAEYTKNSGLHIFCSREPERDSRTGLLSLEFIDRPVKTSVKNFLLEDSKNRSVVLQAGRLGSKEFFADCTWPFTPLQAFAMALVKF